MAHPTAAPSRSDQAYGFSSSQVERVGRRPPSLEIASFLWLRVYDHRAGVVTWQQVRRLGCPVTGGVGVVGDDRGVRGRIVYEPGNGNP